MNRQKIFDNFVIALDGKGQALDGPDCVFFKKDHPGCAIGCQPGFREKFEGHLEGTESIDVVWPEVREFFGSTGDGSAEDFDLGFMMVLQALHDDNENWDGDRLREEILKDFRDEFDLMVTD